MESRSLSRASVYLDRIAHNLDLLRELAGEAAVWPVIKANAYGHGAELVARYVVAQGCDTLCVAEASEALALEEAGVRARYVVLTASLPEQAEIFAAFGFEPVVCTRDMAEALADVAVKAGREVAVHVAVDTGMGRMGIPPDEVGAFLERCRELRGLRVRGLMSHFPRADEADKAYSLEQLERFRRVRDASRGHGIEVHHLANSAAVFDLPDARFDAVRPGIALYGLRPSGSIVNPRVAELRPALEWTTRVTFLKEMPAGVGLSYGHRFRTQRPSLVATLRVGYGDGLARSLSNGLDVLVRGRRCPQVGTITMDQTLVDVTELRGHVEAGDEAVLIGRQGDEEITADEIAEKLGTISYEVVTGLAERIFRVGVA